MLRQGRLGDAVASALRAFRTEDTSDARSALFQTLEATWDIHAVLRGHQSAVWAVGFRPLRQELVSWSADNTLIVWDSAELSPAQRDPAGRSGGCRSAALSPDARILAAGLADGSIQLWDTESTRTLTGLKGRNGSTVLSLAFDAGGTLLAAGHQDGESTASLACHTLARRRQHSSRGRTIPRSIGQRCLSAAMVATWPRPTAGLYAPVDVWALPAGTFVMAVRRSGKFSMNERVGFVSALDADVKPVTYLVVGTSEGVVEISTK